MSHAPIIGHVSKSLVRVFSIMVLQPEQWFTVAELVEAGQASRATVYRRCGNLVSARVLKTRRNDSQAEFAMHPDWRDTTLGAKLLSRLQGGLQTGAKASATAI